MTSPLSGGKRSADAADPQLEAARAAARSLVSKFEPAPANAYTNYGATYAAPSYGSSYGAAPPYGYTPPPAMPGVAPAWNAAAAAAGPQVVQSYTKDKVGRIIGPGGVNITKIRQESGAKVKIDSAPTAGYQQVTYQGTDSQIAAAISLVDRLLATPDVGATGDAADGTVRAEHKQQLDKEAAGKVIGQGGATVKQIREKTGAYIKISSERIPGVDTQTLTVGGTEEQVAAAMVLVTKAMERPSLPDKGPDAASSEVSHQLPEAMAAKVIGPGGANVKKVREATGAKVKIGNERKGEPGNQFQDLHLAGTESQVAAALAMINDIIASDSAPERTVPAGTQSVTAHVALGIAGKIIGPKGANVKWIREQSGARIKVHPTAGQGAATQAVEITGTEQACRIAYAMVMEMSNPNTVAPSGPHTPSHAARPPQAHAYAAPPAHPTGYAAAPPGYGYEQHSAYGAPQPQAPYGQAVQGYGAPQHGYAQGYGAAAPQQPSYGALPPAYAPPAYQQPAAYAQQPAAAYGQQAAYGQPAPRAAPYEQVAAPPSRAGASGYPNPAARAPPPTGYGAPQGYSAPPDYQAGLRAGMAEMLGNLPPDLAAIVAQHQQLLLDQQQ